MNAQMTYVPDDNFEQALIDKGYDSGPLNDSIPTKNIDTVKILRIDEKLINDLTGIEDFFALVELSCSYNWLESLDLSSNLALVKLKCDINLLESLNLKNNTALEVLNCSDNEISSLELSKNTHLVNLDCAINQLTSLDISKNIALEGLNAKDNKPLYCIQVLDSSKAATNSNWYKDDKAIYSVDCNYINTNMTYVPDDNFEQTLIDRGYDSGPLNDSVPTKKIFSIQSLQIDYCKISDLTGIEDFIALEYFICSNNELTSLDFSKNISLKELRCAANKLTSLDLSICSNLEYLQCASNQLSSLDIINNLALKELICYYNKLTKVDLSKNKSLVFLYCSSNQLTSLDVSNNTALWALESSYNALTNLDLRNNTALEELYCTNNSLINLDISNNPALRSLNARNNTNLHCIQVMDSSKAANNGNWNKDKWAIYSEDCGYVGVDEKFDLSDDIVISPNPASDYIDINLERWSPSSGWTPSEILIYNSLGECVLTPLAFGEGPGVRLDISSLPPGLYNCIISTPKFMESVKFIIVR
jgi:Leucine-rich repeat (LRR) protein